MAAHLHDMVNKRAKQAGKKKRLKAPLRIMAKLATADFSDKITKYDLAKRLELSYARIHEAIEGRRKGDRSFPGLEKRGFVKHIKIGKARTGLSKKAYKSTLKGLVYALTHEKTLWDQIDLIAQKNQELLPLVFGKWKHFSDYRCKAMVVKILRRVFGSHYVLMEKLIRIEDAKMIRDFGDDLFANAVYDNVFSPEFYHLLSDPDMKKWIYAIKNDLVLHRKYLDKTKELLDRASEFRELAETRLKNISDSPITKKENEQEKEGGEKA
jgi:hypothetical protein